MRRNRIILGILWVLSLIAISMVGGPITYGFFAMFTLIPVVSIAYLVCVYFFFHIYQQLDGKNLIANQPVPFYFTLMNEYFFGFAGIRVRFYTSFSKIRDLNDETEYELFPGQGIRKETSLVCKYRGEYEVGIKTVEVRDFFRLFCLSYKNPETLRVIVKPAVCRPERLNSIHMDMVSALTARGDEEPDVLLREFEEGDDIRMVSWKAAAKTGKWMVRDRIGQEKQGVGIILSTVRSDTAMEKYLPTENKMLEIMLSLGIFFAENAVPIKGFWQENAMQTTMISVDHINAFQTFYDAVSVIEFSENRTSAQLLTNAKSQYALYDCKAVFLVLDTWDAAACELAESFRTNRIPVVAYIVTDKLEDTVEVVRQPEAQLVYVGRHADLTEVM